MRRFASTARTSARALLAPALLAALLAACSKDDSVTGPAPSPRTYRMGFSGVPPKADQALAIASIDLWSRRADAALILSEPPWDSLLAGFPPDSLVRVLHLPLANYYRSKGHRIVVSVDPTNGLDRSSDSAPLVAAGRSLTEPAVQAVYRAYVTAMDTILRPEYLGFASETNLVKAAAPAALYDALVRVANDAAADVRAADPDVKLFASVQVEVAWGALGGGGAYVGIAQDRADFPFLDALGLSSYPYLGGYAEPDSIPLDYYDRLDDGDPIPMLVIEGGWPSVSIPAAGVVSSPEKQRRYIARHGAILDRARAAGWFQITFTDLDSTLFPPGSILPFFAYNGLVDVDLNAKPSLATWDAIFGRPAAPSSAARIRWTRAARGPILRFEKQPVGHP
ncbi:MAG TPA: hypothetical protein VLT84_02785 [Acidobacteriota bacterium]|nr:hypothetical protein [Acidobacteriota bacterium]